MKKVLFIVLLFFVFSSCEDVVEVDLNTADPRLVIEANSNIYSENMAHTFVRLSTTTPYFDTAPSPVTTAEVLITDEFGNEYEFLQMEDGYYISDLVPEIDVDYTLQVFYDGEEYKGTTHLVPAVPIALIEQIEDGGFSGENKEVRIYFNDTPGESNYYFFEALTTHENEYDTLSDEFIDGNLFFYYYSHEDLEAGDEIIFNLYGITQTNFDFLSQVLQQAQNNSGPFSTQPATVRGNMVNLTNEDNFPLGYFRMSEVSSVVYTVE